MMISFFSERRPIPKSVVHPLSPDGKLGDEMIEERVVREALIREVDAAIAMNMPTARSLYEWLGGKLEQYEARENGDDEKK